MVWEFMVVQFRKTRMGFFVTLFVMLLYVLLKKTPHAGADVFIILLSALQSFTVGNYLFQGYAPDQSFLFSLPLSRRGIFIYRMVLGWALQGITLLCVFAVIASGLRCELQRILHSPFYPMVKWYELNVLWSVGLTTFVCQSFIAYFKTRAVILNKPILTIKNPIRIAFVLFAFMISLSMIPAALGPPKVISIIFLETINAVFTVVFSFLFLSVSYFAYRYMEVKS